MFRSIQPRSAARSGAAWRGLVPTLAAAFVATLSLQVLAPRAAQGRTTTLKTGYALQPLKEGPPSEVAEAIRALLAKEGLRVLDRKGAPYVDLWLRAELPVQEAKEQLGVKFGDIPEGTILAAARFHKDGADFKGNDFPAGVYTLRNGLQPVDGDHQGVSETRDFILLAPAKADTRAEPVSTKEAVKLSVKGTGIKHPSILYLTRMFEDAKALPRMVEDEERELWILDLEMPRPAEKSTKLRLGLVLVGQAREH